MSNLPPPKNPAPLPTPDEALATILAHAAPLGLEVVPIDEGLGRILAEPVRAPRSLPPWDSSAMDGYALRAAEVTVGAPLPVRGVVAAGHPATTPLEAGTVMRIMTGAPLPDGADAVIMREEAEERDGVVRFSRPAAPGQHIRRAGEDLKLGDEVLAAGVALGPGELGLLAGLGRTLVAVHRRPEVTILSTGDELVPADIAPGPGQIVNSNSHALLAQSRQAGARARILPIAGDEKAALRAAFLEALCADVVISSGGVSVGDFDYVREVLAELGAHEQVSKVAMKPGKPIAFSVVDSRERARKALIFGLPGNPASSMVSFELFVYPALRALQGFPAAAQPRPRVRVRLAAEVRPDAQRLHFMRARLERRRDDGELLAHPLRQQGSGMLRSMVGVNAYLHIPSGTEPLPPGSVVVASLVDAV